MKIPVDSVQVSDGSARSGIVEGATFHASPGRERTLLETDEPLTFPRLFALASIIDPPESGESVPLRRGLCEIGVTSTRMFGLCIDGDFGDLAVGGHNYGVWSLLLADVSALQVEMRKKTFGGSVGNSMMLDVGDGSVVLLQTLSDLQVGRRPKSMKDCRPFAEQLAANIAGATNRSIPAGWVGVEDGDVRAELITG